MCRGLLATGRTSGVLLALASLLLASVGGCAHFVETRTIELFARAMQTQDLEQLKARVSSEFEQKALRQDSAIEVLQVLHLPEGKPTVLSVEEISPTEKDVLVEMGEPKRKLKFRLKRDPNSQKWVVDDIFMRQRRPGLTVTKSVSEQMDLLLSVQEFLTVWSQGTRAQVLATATPELAELLGRLPPNYLARLTRRIGGAAKGTFRPHAEMDDRLAYVRLQSGAGPLAATFELTDGSWKLRDLTLAGADEAEQIRSLRELAVIVDTSLSFLRAYRLADNQRLAELCSEAFFQECLEPADLSLVELPAAELEPDKFRTMIRGHRADFIVDEADQRVTISLARTDPGEEPPAAQYRVDEVTIYELDGTQEKRLSALLTARAVFHIFAEALVARDLKTLMGVSTPDFNRRVWKKLDEQSLRDLPMPEVENFPPKILSTVFQGAVTEITAIQGTRALTYRLLDQKGHVLVDDVLLPVFDRPTSLKGTLELLIPIRRFVTGFRTNSLDLLHRSSSADLNRLVWHQMTSVPSLGWPVAQHLNAPLTRVEPTEHGVRVWLGDSRWGALVDLVQESDRYLVDDVQLIAGPDPQQRLRLKQALRLEIAHRQSTWPRRTGTDIESPASGSIAPLGFESPPPADPGRLPPTNGLDAAAANSAENLSTDFPLDSVGAPTATTPPPNPADSLLPLP